MHNHAYKWTDNAKVWSNQAKQHSIAKNLLSSLSYFSCLKDWSLHGYKLYLQMLIDIAFFCLTKVMVMNTTQIRKRNYFFYFGIQAMDGGKKELFFNWIWRAYLTTWDFFWNIIKICCDVFHVIHQCILSIFTSQKGWKGFFIFHLVVQQ